MENITTIKIILFFGGGLTGLYGFGKESRAWHYFDWLVKILLLIWVLDIFAPYDFYRGIFGGIPFWFSVGYVIVFSIFSFLGSR